MTQDLATIHYAPSTGGFYVTGINTDIPGDAIVITVERWTELLDIQAKGGEIRPGADGKPVAEIPATTLDDLKAAAIAGINAEYEVRVRQISTGYPSSERESWPVQTAEARALLADAEAATPWIDAAAGVRAIDRAELAQRIVALDNQYRAVHGRITGERQLLVSQVQAAKTDKAVIAAALWPEAS